jgi:hypothetical protein
VRAGVDGDTVRRGKAFRGDVDDALGAEARDWDLDRPLMVADGTADAAEIPGGASQVAVDDLERGLDLADRL